MSRPTADLYPRYSGYYRQLCRLPRRVRRQLQRQWRRSLSALALLLALGQAPALAANITVAPGIPPAINADGLCALIEAIDNANADAQTHTDCVAGNGADSIALPLGSTQSLTAVDNTTHGPTGLPVITSTITLRGRNSTIRRESSAPAFRILAVASSGNLSLYSTTVSGGRSASGDFFGGEGVYNNGILTLTNSTVSGNSGYSEGGVFNSGSLTLTHSTVSGNGNTLVGYGRGGVVNSGTAILTHSTVSGNKSVYCGHCGGAGGISNRGRGTLTLTNSTVSGNISFGYSGVDNSGKLTLARTLISGNEDYFSRSPEVENFGGTVVTNNRNLFGHDGDAGVAGFSPGPTDIVPNAPLNAIRRPLADNGGPTRTHALPAGSPALNASPANSGCRPTDQCGVTRPQGAACDIGAFERGPPVRCNGQIARILGTVGNDSLLSGTPGPDVIHGLAGHDTIDGIEGNDIICGHTGNDILFGGTGADALNGGSGTDTCDGGSGTDTGASCETEISIP